jgi:hypothetical protein
MFKCLWRSGTRVAVSFFTADFFLQNYFLLFGNRTTRDNFLQFNFYVPIRSLYCSPVNKFYNPKWKINLEYRMVSF